MEKTVKASVAGIGFTFDTGAFQKLESYLNAIARLYKNYPDGDEITADIEARIVELILSRQSVEQIVREDLVAEIVEQMGMPELTEEFPEEPKSEVVKSFPKRLYRNKEGSKLGGVCSGLATYFKIDPVWLRLFIFLPLLLLILLSTVLKGAEASMVSSFLGTSFATMVMLYFILWIVVPLARTPRQRLEMEGGEITVDSIGRKARADSERYGAEQKPETVLSRLFVVFGNILLFCIKLFAFFIAFSFAVSAIAIIVAIICVTTGVAFAGAEEIYRAVPLMEGASVKGYVSMVLGVCLIPLVIIVYQLCRLIFSFRNNRALMWILCVSWFVLAVYVGVLTVRNSEKFNRPVVWMERIELTDNKVEFEGKNHKLSKSYGEAGVSWLSEHLTDDFQLWEDAEDNEIILKWMGRDGILYVVEIEKDSTQSGKLLLMLENFSESKDLNTDNDESY